MSPTSEERLALASAARDLSGRVDDLTHHLSVSQKQIRRTRMLTVLTCALSVLSLLGGLTSVYLLAQVNATSRLNKDAAVQNCKNNNASRAASQGLWTWVLDVSSAQQKNQDPRTAKILDEMRTYVGQVYYPRDCTDLTKIYDVPKPPPVIQPVN